MVMQVPNISVICQSGRGLYCLGATGLSHNGVQSIVMGGKEEEEGGAIFDCLYSMKYCFHFCKVVNSYQLSSTSTYATALCSIIIVLVSFLLFCIIFKKLFFYSATLIMAQQQECKNLIVFGINGHKKEVDLSELHPSTTLLHYIRNYTDFRGPKFGCGEGGCGACLVHLSKCNPNTGDREEYSVASCLTLVGSLHGCSITTSEGLGNSRDGYHAIHSRIGGFHASQCGFCTPGMSMSIFSALRQAENKANDKSHLHHGFPNLSVNEAHKWIAGNLCRCTGYRPLADVCKSFAGDVDLEDLGLNTFWNKNQNENTKDVTSLPSFTSRKVCTFPKFLESVNSSCYNQIEKPLFNFNYIHKYNGQKYSWIKPTSLDGIFETLNELNCNGNSVPELKLVVGNTSSGVYRESRPSLFLDISSIPELNFISKKESCIEIGAAVTIARAIESLEDKDNMGGLDHNSVFKTIASHLKKVASKFVRNTASIGGNLIMAQQLSFESDIATVLLGVGASIKIMASHKTETVLSMDDFLEKNTQDRKSQLLISIIIPSWNEVGSLKQENIVDEQVLGEDKFLFKTYRAAPRPLGNAVSYVNAAFLVQVTPAQLYHQWKLGPKIQLAFGAFGTPHAIRSTDVEKFLSGKVMTAEILLEAIELLKLCVIPMENTPKAAYRQSVAVGFLFEFFWPLVKDTMVPSKALCARKDDGPGSGNLLCNSKGPVAGKQVLEIHNNYSPVGQPAQKIGVELQASGEAVFVNDIPAPNNCLYGEFVLSAKPLALVEKINVQHIIDTPNSLSFVSVSDIPVGGKNLAIQSIFGDEPLFADKIVECVGQPIGLMVANSPLEAKMAAEKVKVHYNCETTGPPILTVEDAVKRESFFQVPDFWSPKPAGDFQKGMSEAENKIESAEVRTGSQYFFYLETQTALAIPDEDHGMTVYSSTQNPGILQTVIAKCLATSENNVRVITRRVGGGFGGKAFRAMPVAVACALAAYKLKRPVRMFLDRKTDMLTTGGRHPVIAKYTVGYKNDGKITALHVDLFINAGFSMDISPMMPRFIVSALKKYNWGSLSIGFKVCKTNLPSKSTMRGPGDTQGSFIAEVIIEHVASALCLDTSLVRERNMHTFESSELFYENSIGHPNFYTMPSIWEKLKHSASLERRKKSVDTFNESQCWNKRGLSMVPCFHEVFLNCRPARVTIFTDGSISVEVGGIELGQGLWTKVKQVTAYVLSQLGDIPSEVIYSKIRVVQHDTISLAHGGYTAGSTTSEESCAAVEQACKILIERLFTVKKNLTKRKQDQLSWNELISKASLQSADLSAQVYWAPDSSARSYVNFGAAAAEVEVDLLTGATTILQVDIIYDCGRSLNPAIDIGQIEGAFVQGIGYFTTEEVIVDQSGKVVSDGTWTYKVPTVDTVPRKINVELLSSPMNQKRVLSSKASGEPPLLLASSVHCAIREAIRSARKDQKDNSYFRMDSPATMDVIKSLCGFHNVEYFLQNLSSK